MFSFLRYSTKSPGAGRTNALLVAGVLGAVGAGGYYYCANVQSAERCDATPLRQEVPPLTPGFRVIREPQPRFYLLRHETVTDEQAATSVYNHFSQRKNNPRQIKAEQELSRLILFSPFMTSCLGEVIHWANILFFEGKLTVEKVDLQLL
ncbi:hypothetical protein FGG08_007373 [Glutinoglossum americanum]|uniref:Uncharacterized protein n=1 Tax=Glutinoglossum americanum TaxID=1670608 RepID=A0A9P8KWH8_9PEZI|nr:hypothetical protein FGG08_007373 [Glutinoglossum americanum]